MHARLLFFAGLALLHLVPHAQAAPAPTRPNVVVFITDDESWLERSAYGWSNVPTPHFDRVAREGVLFTRGHTSAPSCAPSRASLLTGRNFWELEEGAFIQAWLPSKFATVPDLMEAGGYFAGYTGKGWGPPESYTWGPDTQPQSGRRCNPAGNSFNDVKVAVRERAISEIDYPANLSKFLDAKPAEKPFWFWIGSVEPHTPLDPENYKKLEAEKGIKLEDVKVSGFLPDTIGVRKNRANMMYEVCRADDNLGKVLSILEQRGELANTLLIVTGDNGTQVLRSKANVHDWGTRVPLAMMWPAKVKPGRKVDDFVNFIDLAPTMLDAAGLPIPKEMSGRSALNVLTSDASGRVDPSRSWTVTGLEWHGEQAPISLAARSIRDERYQYIVNYSDSPRRKVNPRRAKPDAEYEVTAAEGNEIDLVTSHPEHSAVKKYFDLFVAPRPAEELYDTQTDPWELTNLAASPEHAEIKQKLKSQLEAYQRQTNDPRITGDMALFERTRTLVEDRKYGQKGYSKTKEDE